MTTFIVFSIEVALAFAGAFLAIGAWRAIDTLRSENHDERD